MAEISSLGGAILPSVATALGANPVLGIVSMAANAVQQKQASDAYQKQMNMQNKINQANVNARLKELNLQEKQAEETRIKNLKSAIAKQKASFAGSGISSAGTGSSKSVITGFLSNSDEEKKQRQELSSLKKQALQEDLARSTESNLLKMSQKEQENNMKKIFDLF